jgi:hypothetical protein
MQPTAEEKVRERRLRRAALRKGVHPRKSNILDPDWVSSSVLAPPIVTNVGPSCQWPDCGFRLVAS